MNLLLVSPSISDMYKDIVSQLNMMNISVDYIEDRGNDDDPDYIRNKKRIGYREKKRADYLQKNENRWNYLLSKKQFNKRYDYLLVIDGMSVSPYLFNELKRRNPQIWCANYLYDSTVSLYRFQINFQYYNLVASFDRQDCKRYNLKFLPIYWQDKDCINDIRYKFFGVGGFSQERFQIYKQVLDYAENHGLSYYIKLYYPRTKNILLFTIKAIVKRLLGNKESITISQYNSKYVTHDSISSDEYRILMNQSEIIIDSVNFEQDGMTARFMWALGFGKKIITTNASFHDYDCYDKNQVLIVNNSWELYDSINTFVSTPFVNTDKHKEKLIGWRLDNWLGLLLNYK